VNEMASEIFGDEYECRAKWEWGIAKCPKCGNSGDFFKDEKGIYEASPPVKDEKGNILKIQIDPPPKWEDGRRRYICYECGHLDYAIEFIKGVSEKEKEMAKVMAKVKQYLYDWGKKWNKEVLCHNGVSITCENLYYMLHYAVKTDVENLPINYQLGE